ncbi:MAG: AraC family transcriptional regulator [Planctomycetes bacterium]|nr:AraC family transcriptional regulator [Planctomycetota bacterium]
MDYLPGSMPPTPCGDARRRLVRVYSYHCPRGRQPTPTVIEAGRERVELVTAGGGWWRDDGVERPCGPGALLWQAVGDQTIARSDPASGYRCLVLWFEVPRGVMRPLPRWTQVAEVAEVRQFARELLTAVRGGGTPLPAIAAHAWGRLLFLACRKAQTELPAPLQRMREYIELNLYHPIEIADLCVAAGWSSSTLHARCQAHCGCTPQQLVMEVRLDEARSLLARTDMPLGEVARRCGFVAQAHFTRAFARAVGMAPSAWRREQRAEPTWYTASRGLPG